MNCTSTNVHTSEKGQPSLAKELRRYCPQRKAKTGVKLANKMTSSSHALKGAHGHKIAKSCTKGQHQACTTAHSQSVYTTSAHLKPQNCPRRYWPVSTFVVEPFRRTAKSSKGKHYLVHGYGWLCNMCRFSKLVKCNCPRTC